jgi:tRNA nucleotidyltransferase (CCA-adding enzyme)
LGGGGHATAASAAVKHLSASESLDSLRNQLIAEPPRPRRVRDLMSSPVHTVAPETPLAELADSLSRWRHTGAPVVRDGELVGIVSSRDLERAADGRMQLPVSSCMSQQPITVSPDASLEDAQALMEQHDVGRLPVLRGGRLVGIVTRADLLRVLYAGQPGG